MLGRKKIEAIDESSYIHFVYEKLFIFVVSWVVGCAVQLRHSTSPVSSGVSQIHGIQGKSLISPYH